MSMHEIEDLVEETTYLIDRSSNHDRNEKRDILSNLYHLEAFFDTSYTHFRVMDILVKNRFVYKIPLADYPQLGITDDQLPSDGDGDWICDDNKNEIGFAEIENGILYLYCDAGDKGWERLCELDILPKAEHQPPQKFSIPQLIKIIMLEAETQQQNHLLKQWYNLFTNAALEGDFGKNEGVPDSFDGFLNDAHLPEFRDIAMRNQLAGQQPSQDGNYLSFPGLKGNLSGTEGLEENYKVRYLLELSKETNALEAAYHKDKQALEN